MKYKVINLSLIGLSAVISPIYAVPFIKDSHYGVRDISKKLLWQDSSDIQKTLYTHNDAMQYCKTLPSNNGSEWRLPTLEEVDTIVEPRNKNKINGTFSYSSNFYYWTSSKDPIEPKNAYAMGFYYGKETSQNKNLKALTRCVKTDNAATYTLNMNNDTSGFSLIVNQQTHTINLYDPTSGRNLITLNSNEINPIEFTVSENKEYLYLRNANNDFVVLDLKTKENIVTLKDPNQEIAYLLIDEDKKYITKVLKNNSISLLDSKSLETLVTLNKKIEDFVSLTISEDKNYAVLKQSDNKYTILNAKTNEEIVAFKLPYNQVAVLQHNTEQNFVTLQVNNNETILFDLVSKKEVVTLPNGYENIKHYLVNKDQNFITLETYANKFVILNKVTNQIIFSLNNYEKNFVTLTLSEDKKIVLAKLVDNSYKLLDINSKKEIAVLTDINEGFTSLTVSENKKYIILSYPEVGNKVFDIATGKVIITLNGKYNDLAELSFSENKQFAFLKKTNKQLIILDLPNQKELATISEDIGLLTNISIIDNSIIATPTDKNGLYVINSTNGTVLYGIADNMKVTDAIYPLMRNEKTQIVRDVQNHLLWQDNSDVAYKNFEGKSGWIFKDYPAEEFCDDLKMDDSKDWRLPTVEEFNKLRNAIDIKDNSLKYSNGYNYEYWTSDKSPTNSDYSVGINIYNGKTFYKYMYQTLNVRCVMEDEDELEFNDYKYLRDQLLRNHTHYDAMFQSLKIFYGKPKLSWIKYVSDKSYMKADVDLEQYDKEEYIVKFNISEKEYDAIDDSNDIQRYSVFNYQGELKNIVLIYNSNKIAIGDVELDK